MLKCLANHSYFCYLDGYLGFFQILINLNDQEKTTFICLYGTFANRQVLFGLCNTPTIFQLCIMDIFSNLIEDTIDVFMDDFSVYGSTFDSCLSNLSIVLQCSEEVNLVSN